MQEKTAGGQHGLIYSFFPFITAWSHSTMSPWCSRESKHWNLFHCCLSIPISPLWAHTLLNSSISSGFSPRYPLKKLKTGFQRPLSDRHTMLTADIFHASFGKAWDAICGTTENCSTKLPRLFWNEISSFNLASVFRLCCSTNVCSTVCHQHVTNYSRSSSHNTPLLWLFVIQMKD